VPASSEPKCRTKKWWSGGAASWTSEVVEMSGIQSAPGGVAAGGHREEASPGPLEELINARH
jgi:hypothetical protein